MSEHEFFFQCMTLELSEFIQKIQLGRKLDVEAFERIYENSQKLTQELKYSPMVPKAVLNELRIATKVLRSEAVYMGKEEEASLDMAKKLEMMFDLILLGESHNDRIPGIPRII